MGSKSCDCQAGFDAIVGNPPFVNAIEGRINPVVKPLLRRRFRLLEGTADLGFYFVELSRSITKGDGQIGLIQPRAFLNARPAARLRAELTRDCPPQYLFAPNRADLFPGASVFVCIVILGRRANCLISTNDSFINAIWEPVTIDDENWWDVINRTLNGRLTPTITGPMIKDAFSVSASMTTGEAYDVVPLVVDEQHGNLLKLVTTGLIDPGVCLWGIAQCRYLKRDFEWPRVRPSADLPKGLQKRLAQARRPKVIIAGLSKRVECFLDSGGEYIGAISTYSVFHASDDLTLLSRLTEYLLSDGVTERFKSVLGANAMGGGNTTMKKEFLETLNLPPEWPA